MLWTKGSECPRKLRRAEFGDFYFPRGGGWEVDGEFADGKRCEMVMRGRFL